MKCCIPLTFIAILLLSGCSGALSPQEDQGMAEVQTSDAASVPQVGSCSPWLEAAESNEEAISNVLNGEGTFVVGQDIDKLMDLWVAGSLIADAKNTPDKSDDQVWQDKDAIRHRYVRIVFPGAPSVAQPSNLDISIQGSEAVVMATTNIGDEVSPHGDEWRLVNQDGCWLIKSLTYNLEAK